MLTLVAMLILPATGAWAKGPKEPKGPKGPKGPKHITVDDDRPADYADIQAAIDSEPDGTEIRVAPGTYNGFLVDGRHNLKIEGEGKHNKGDVIVTGSVSAATYKGTFPLTIGVKDSTKIEITGLTVQAGLTDPFTIAYFNSTGKVKNNEVSGNTGSSRPGNAIAVFGSSSPGTASVTIESNFIHHYGKIGILVNSRTGSYTSSYGENKEEYADGGIHDERK